MAAPAKKVVGVSDDSSSSDDEALKRCQEAVWETRTDKKKDGNSNVQQSKRVVVADHEHDGNELQVTQGFRTHVAKKLGHLLDSCITVIQDETSSSCVTSAKCDDDEGKDSFYFGTCYFYGDSAIFSLNPRSPPHPPFLGFRLFSTSVPGQTADDPPAPVRRRPIPSSSDSDSEMETRLREAAVSVKDLLPSSSLPSTLSTPSAEKIKTKQKKKLAEGEESHVVKKKRKQKKGESDSAGSPLSAQSNGEHRSSEQEHMQVKGKRKKRELNTEEKALN
ncbi:protein CUSTOS isoform X1 [Siniperca chuatsi]|uniref:protein CUSTOS isoform X1 n=1 Tax=Siniperca chuatsi TaxID=119488 RepID=UPI001CE10EA2|nr:protein CUSTOS isoform X1 [Siniperca chuatsi]